MKKKGIHNSVLLCKSLAHWSTGPYSVSSALGRDGCSVSMKWQPCLT